MLKYSHLKFGYIVQVLFVATVCIHHLIIMNICHGCAKQLPSGKNRHLLKCQQSVPGALYEKQKSTDLQLSLCPQVVVADWEMHEWRRMGRVLQSQQHVKSSPSWLGSKHTTLILPPIQHRDFHQSSVGYSNA